METYQGETTTTPISKSDLLARIDREWHALQSSYAGLNDEQMNITDTGGWSIKDNLAHVAAWERFMRLAYLGKMPQDKAMGIEQEKLELMDEDGVNAVLHDRHKDQSVADVLAEGKRTHQEVLDALNGMSFEEMMAPFPDDPQQRPLIGGIIENTYDHYRHHRANIEKLVKKVS